MPGQCRAAFESALAAVLLDQAAQPDIPFHLASMPNPALLAAQGVPVHQATQASTRPAALPVAGTWLLPVAGTPLLPGPAVGGDGRVCVCAWWGCCDMCCVVGPAAPCDPRAGGSMRAARRWAAALPVSWGPEPHTLNLNAQEAGQFLVTFPGAYHCGFGLGCNVREAVDAAPADWLRYGSASLARLRRYRRPGVLSHDRLLLQVRPRSALL